MNKKKIWIPILSIAVVLLAGVGILIGGKCFFQKGAPGFRFADGGLMDKIKESITGEKESEEETVIEGLKRNDPIELSIGLHPLDYGAKTWGELVQLYEDPELKCPVYAEYFYDEENQKIVLTPSDYPQARIFASGLTVEEARKYEQDGTLLFPKDAREDWGNLENFYMAEYYDLMTGEKLDEPKVTVIHKIGEIEETPVLEYTLIEDGNVRFDWTKVKGAEAYLICTIAYRDNEKGYDEYCTIHEVTTETSWELPLPDYNEISVGDKANAIFYRLEAAENLDEDTKKTAICVFAVNGEGTSMMSNTIKAEEFASQLPCSLDIKTWETEGYQHDVYDSYQELPEYAYVEMCDGTVQKRKIHYDLEAARIYMERYMLVEDGEIVGGETAGALKIPYTIEDTAFDRVATVRDMEEKDLEEALNFLETRE